MMLTLLDVQYSKYFINYKFPTIHLMNDQSLSGQIIQLKAVQQFPKYILHIRYTAENNLVYIHFYYNNFNC